MASKPFIFLFLAFSVFLFPTTLSRAISETTTIILDVSASLRQTHQVLSSAPQSLSPFTQQQEESSTTFSSSFSLRLLTRETFSNVTHNNYRSLVLSRLERDSARVDSITARLELALDNVKKLDLKPADKELQVHDLSTPVVSGASQGSGEYFSRVGVGSPPKEFYMVLDTGSDVNWLQCQPCSDCYQQSDPVFNPSGSSSYAPLSCGSKQCGSLKQSGCRSGICQYQVSYGDGSYTVGDFVTETVSFGNSGSVNGVALGCGHDDEGLFVGAAGLFGLGGGPLSITSQIKATSLSYCLVDRNSGKSSTLDFNSPQPSDSVTAPLLRNAKLDTFYYVGLTDMSVGGELLSIPPSLFQLDDSGAGGIIVDSGTSITRLQTQAYNSLRDAFVKQTQHLKTTRGVALFDTCYDLSSLTRVRVPVVSFHFAGGKSWVLPAKNYLVAVDSTGTFCFAFAPTTSSLSIIGNVQQQGTRVTFDLRNSVVGFSPNKC